MIGLVYWEWSLTKFIIQDFHSKKFHAGAQSTLNIIRQNFCIINARDIIRKNINHGIRCYRTIPPTPNYMIGNLPESRIRQSRPCTHIDYCGPCYLKEKYRRKRNKEQVYVFFDLTTEAFLAALKQFFARSRKYTDIFYCNV